MQHNIFLDHQHAAMPAKLNLGQHTNINLCIHVNGHLISADSSTNGYLIRENTWKDGDNSLLIELRINRGNPPKLGIGLTGDIHDINVSFKDTSINLADNDWRLLADFARPYQIEPIPDNTVATLNNGMVHPLTRLAVAGVAWYQGESNAERAFQYRKVLPLLINDWREQWKREVPFLIVQLPSFGPSVSSNAGSKWAELREAQLLTSEKLKSVGLSVNIDTGDPNNLHPTDKRTVGTRLAATALGLLYSKPEFEESPVFDHAVFQGGASVIYFKKLLGSLTVKDRYGYVKGFEIAGADHVFHYAKAEIEGNAVRVWAKEVVAPEAVRYAWTNSCLEANLITLSGVPVAPFRTDDWHLLTIDNKLH